MKAISENDIDKTSKAVTKILRQTQEGEISWTVDSRKLFLGADEYLTGQVYQTFILGKFLRIFKYYKTIKAQYIITNESNIDGIKLQFTDSEGKPEWDFPYSNAVKDLYETISFSTNNVQEFLDKWINE